MNKTNKDVLETVISLAAAEQVKRTLAVMRIRGWRFPEQCAVGVKILAATALVTQVDLRIDDVHAATANVSTDTPAEDLSVIIDGLVAEWLTKHATERPRSHR